ncbi:MAG: trypsin-like peptidase domain-containing protein [Candidatus Latescibacteria bacterium]|nr:trypsin-like peptidase domain-containing protein [Candidatus Latescibacterota bacterium]
MGAFFSTDSRANSIDESRRTAVVRAVERVQPSVASLHVRYRERTRQLYQFRGDPLWNFFSPFYYIVPQDRVSTGSGFVIDDTGYILTNSHVIGDPRHLQHISVSLPGFANRTFQARYIASDINFDLAVLKIDDAELPVAPLGDSDDILVGEWAIAVGNPFDLGPTVSIGVVSALDRDFQEPQGDFYYRDMIQTDAAINPGNSGGPLANAAGEVIGINSFIYTGGDYSIGSIGIGFAIPVNLVQDVMAQLVEYGEVRRGLLGVGIGDIEPLVAEAMGLDNTHGVLVERVFKGKAADKAGVKVDDIVLAVDGLVVRNSTELKSRIGRTAPGVEVELLVLRNGKEKRIDVELGQLDEEVLAAGNPRGGDEEVQGPLGVRVEELTDELARRLGYEDERGVLVSRVAPGSEADRRGLDRGDLIQAINRIEVGSVDDYEDLLTAIEPGDAFMMRVWSRDNNSSELVGMRMPVH